jgi:hypothetical protein
MLSEEFSLFQARRDFYKWISTLNVPVKPDTLNHGGFHFLKHFFGYLQVIVHLTRMVADGQRFRGGVVTILSDNGGWHKINLIVIIGFFGMIFHIFPCFF